MAAGERNAPRARGFVGSPPRLAPSQLAEGRCSHEELAAEAIGAFIEFWGFKRNAGRLWTLLYLRGGPLTAAEIQRSLKLTKGAVSMITRDLEYWGVIQRTRLPGRRAFHFVAETNLVKLVARVLREREANVILRVKIDLQQAVKAAREARAPQPAIRRLKRLVLLAEAAEQTLALFLRSTQTSLGSLFRLMQTSL